MKVTTFISIEQEVEVDISTEQIINALLADTDSLHTCLQGINNLSKFLRAIPASILHEMKPGSRALIASFFATQATRFELPAKPRKNRRSGKCNHHPSSTPWTKFSNSR